MGQVRHGSATTTHAIRAAIQRSQASTAALSREFGINPNRLSGLTLYEYICKICTSEPDRLILNPPDTGTEYLTDSKS